MSIILNLVSSKVTSFFVFCYKMSEFFLTKIEPFFKYIYPLISTILPCFMTTIEHWTTFLANMIILALGSKTAVNAKYALLYHFVSLDCPHANLPLVCFHAQDQQRYFQLERSHRTGSTVVLKQVNFLNFFKKVYWFELLCPEPFVLGIVETVTKLIAHS